MNTQNRLQKVNERIRKVIEFLAGLKSEQKKLQEQWNVERSSIEPIGLKLREATPLGETSFNYLEIEILIPLTLMDALSFIPSPYGIGIPIPKFKGVTYTIDARHMGVEECITQRLTESGCILKSEMVQAIELDNVNPGSLSRSNSGADEFGVVHRTGNVFISDVSTVRQHFNGPTQNAPSFSQKPGCYTPTLYLSPFGPRTKVFIGLPS